MNFQHGHSGMQRTDIPGEALRLDGVTKKFGEMVAVDAIDLSITRGEFLTLLGPSGCGKTTTLNLIAGFFPPTSGAIYLNGEHVEDLPPFKRDTGMVFQDYALFPHMTVAQNVAFGLKMRKVPTRDAERRVQEALALVHLAGLGERRPVELSGGQRQRVALARALVIEPAVLLFDEPLSNLDLKLRESMRLEITNIQKQLGITAIYVTHDQSEALVMSDRIAVMNAGQIEQLGTARDIYETPRTKFVAEFIGNMNVFSGEVSDAGGRDRKGTVTLACGLQLPALLPDDVRKGDQVHLSVRPEKCRIASTAATGESLSIRGQVSQIVYLGSITEYHLAFPGGSKAVIEVHNINSGAAAFSPGADVYMIANLDHCHVLPARESGSPNVDS